MTWMEFDYVTKKLHAKVSRPNMSFLSQKKEREVAV